MTKITGLKVRDIRFPTSQWLDGSDAMNPDPDYSAAYCVLETDTPGLEGVSEATLNAYGLTRPFPGAAEADHVQLHGG